MKRAIGRFAAAAASVSVVGVPLAFASNDAGSWTPDQVGQWLNKAGLGQYAPAFRRDNIDGSILLGDLTASMAVSELGVKRVHRQKLVNALSALRTGSGDDGLRSAYTKFDDDFPDLTKANNHLKDHLTPQLYAKYRDVSTPSGFLLDYAIQTGIDNLHPNMKTVGILAGDEESFAVWAELFDPIIADRHNGYPADFKQKADVDFSKLTAGNLDPKYVMSTRVRCARNIRGIAFPPWCTRAERREVENIIEKATQKMVDSDITGKYEPLKSMTHDREKYLTDKHLMFHFPQVPGGKCLLVTGNMGRDWPDGRGGYIADSETFLVWANEEDHIRIVSMQYDNNMIEVAQRFGRAKEAMAVGIKELGYEYAYNDHLGFLAACPSNLGGGIRAGLWLKVPHLSKHPRFTEILKNLRLQKRGTGGDGLDGKRKDVWDISNLDRLGFTEVQLVQMVITGTTQLIEMEKALEKGKSLDSMIPEAIKVPWE